MPKYENVGWYYPKKHFMTKVDASWETVAAIVIPPYAVCQNYNLRVNAATISNDNTGLNEMMYWGVKGFYFPLPSDHDFTSDSAPMSLINTYNPLGVGEWHDTDTTAVDTEFPGHFETSKEAKRMQFFDRERALHVNDGTSVISGDNQLTFADQFSTKGRVYKKGMGIKIEDTKILVFVARGDVPVVTSDWSDVLTGNTSHGQHLTQELWKQLGRGSTDEGYPSGLDSSLDANVQQWLLNGMREGTLEDYSQAQRMFVNAKLSVRVKMVAPTSDRHISGG